MKRDFRLFIPIVKSVQADDGQLIHHGLADDEDLDAAADFFQKSLPYLTQWGKFIWRHGGTEIGDVTEARIVTPEEARALLGPGVKVVGKALYVRGSLYPVIDPGLASDDLTKGRAALLAGEKLGYGIQGIALRRDGKVTGALAARIAIMPQPTHADSTCILAKSLGALSANRPPGLGFGPNRARVVQVTQDALARGVGGLSSQDATNIQKAAGTDRWPRHEARFREIVHALRELDAEVTAGQQP